MVEQAEIERSRLKPTENLDAYDFFLRGLAKTHQQTNAAISEALQLFHKATELDTGFGSGLRHGRILLPRAPGLFVDD